MSANDWRQCKAGRAMSMTPAQRKLHTWMAFTVNTTEAEARAAFVKKHGREPQWVGAGLNQVMAGPLPPRDGAVISPTS